MNTAHFTLARMLMTACPNHIVTIINRVETLPNLELLKKPLWQKLAPDILSALQ